MAAAAIQPYIMAGNRRAGKVLVLNAYRFQRNKVLIVDNKIYWRCCHNNCRTGLVTNFVDVDNPNAAVNIIRGQPVHNHAPDDELISREDFVLAVMNLIARDPSCPIKRLYNEVLAGWANNHQDVPSFHELRSRLQRRRAAMCPLVPRRIQDVRINGVWSEAWDGSPRLQRLNNRRGIALFASSTELEALGQCQTIYFDGTFRTAPRPYVQILSIHGLYQDWVIPLGMCLLTGKTGDHYEYTLRYLKAAVLRETGQRLSPRSIITDFEVALMNAIDQEFPTARKYGCYFHLCQSLWRKVQELGLQQAYRADRLLKKCIKKVFAIGYLPLARVAPAFANHSRSNVTRRLIARHPALQQFLTYVDNTYIRSRVFPPAVWNVYARSMTTRTNNHVEGFHSRWNMVIGRTHPSLWIVIRKMKDEGRRSERSVAAALRGDNPPRRRRKWRRVQARITRLKNGLRRGGRNLNQYWNAISYVASAYV